MKWEYYDRVKKCFHLPDSKSGEKDVTIPPLVAELLEGQVRVLGNPYIFPGKKEGKHFVGLPKIWNAVRIATRIPDVHIHDLRHTFASMAVTANKPMAIIASLLGHRSLAATERYAHAAPNPVAEAAAVVSDNIARGLSRNQVDSEKKASA